MGTQIYVEYEFEVQPAVPGNDILVAQLTEIGFESFLEEENKIMAYIDAAVHTSTILDELPLLKSDSFKVKYQMRTLPQQNWNANWEREFSPINIGNTCQIRASFHPPVDAEYEIVINPKMSFGTGHHSTTYLMAQYILEEDMADKKLLDMGSGTGILAILAEKRGAKPIDAVDIDEWCYNNCLENIKINNCRHIRVYLGDICVIQNKKYDGILANINRNVLLKDMEMLSKSLKKNGYLYLSGFYESDLELIAQEAQKWSLQYQNHKFDKSWVAAAFRKTDFI